MRSQAIKQIVLIVLAIVIAVVVIRPKLNDIREAQTDIQSYETALASVGIYNRQLQSLLSEANSLSNADRAALDRYLPTKIDKTAVARDIDTVAKNNGLLVLEITAEEPMLVRPIGQEASAASGQLTTDASAVVVVDGETMPTTGLLAHQFAVQVIGRYEDMKGMLSDIERNNYPLRLVEFEFHIEEATTLVQYDMVIETYSLNFE